jgi:hypothetical protein
MAIEVGFGNGSITFVPPVPGRRASTRVENNVTIVETEIPAKPAHYDVSFQISANDTAGPLATFNVFHLNLKVFDADHREAYRSVEEKAAEMVAPLLREIASKIEESVLKPSYASDNAT